MTPSRRTRLKRPKAPRNKRHAPRGRIVRMVDPPKRSKGTKRRSFEERVAESPALQRAIARDERRRGKQSKPKPRRPTRLMRALRRWRRKIAEKVAG